MTQRPTETPREALRSLATWAEMHEQSKIQICRLFGHSRNSGNSPPPIPDGMASLVDHIRRRQQT